MWSRDDEDGLGYVKKEEVVMGRKERREEQ
jgi:hypothetical protein